MYELIKKQIAAEYFQQKFSNDGQRFVAWYLRNILLRDMNETRDDVTDGANDKQIDAIVIDDDKSLVRVIQGKFIKTGVIDAEPLRETLSAWIQLKDLARLQSVANPKLQRKLSEMAVALEGGYEVSFELVTTATFTESAKGDLETFQIQLARIGENEEFNATIHAVEIEELKRRYDYAIESDNPSINYKLAFSTNLNILVETPQLKQVGSAFGNLVGPFFVLAASLACVVGVYVRSPVWARFGCWN